MLAVNYRIVFSIALITMITIGQAAFCQSVYDHLNKDEPPPNAIWLETLDLSKMWQEWGKPTAAKSVDGNPITINGVTFKHGLGTHAQSEIVINLNGVVTGFVSVVGLDDETNGKGSVVFEVWVDGRKVSDSGLLHSKQSKLLYTDLQNAKQLILRVNDGDDGIDFDHADWAGAVLFLDYDAKSKPVSYLPVEPLPKIAPASTTLAIHGPRIVGATPGRPFIFLVPATGKGPLTYSAKNLPKGLTLNSKTGIITGSIKSAGTYTVELAVRNAKGKSSRKLRIVSGKNKLALTPPMGWNSWNVWAGAIDAKKVREAADWMLKTGLAARGFQYINIDDCWENGRDKSGEILTNKQFPNMKTLSDYVHSKGLKLGIYSSPGPKTCAGFEGSYQHEAQDAITYAKWGIDYLKYDWCSYGSIAKDESLAELQEPYRVMHKALDECGRDIVYSICQYGMGNVWQWGAEIGGNCWRTTSDIRDNWGSISSNGFSQDGHEKFASPGHWNDPDMLVVGKLGWGPNLQPTMLTPNEQITHITLWSLLSSPMLLGCDLSQMDQFTIDLMSNDEVLAVNQDPLGKPAGRKVKIDQAEVWARPLWDGTTAVGLFNRGPGASEITAQWSDIGIKGSQPVRDLWQQKNLGEHVNSFSATVPRHGAVLLKIGKPNRTDW